MSVRVVYVGACEEALRSALTVPPPKVEVAAGAVQEGRLDGIAFNGAFLVKVLHGQKPVTWDAHRVVQADRADAVPARSTHDA